MAGLVSLDLPTYAPLTTTTTTTRVKPTTAPTPKRTTTRKPPRTTQTSKRNNLKKDMEVGLACPKIEKIPFQWFPLPCDSHKQCKSMGKNYRCCEINSVYKSCTKGVLKPVPEQKHLRKYLTVN